VLERLVRRADALEGNFRRYTDACYGKVTSRIVTGTSAGTGNAHAEGVVAGGDWSVAWDANSDVQWQESWVGRANLDNETTVMCRVLWSDIETDADLIRTELTAVKQSAQEAGIYPGLVRDLLADYQLEDPDL
jgi:hypothetical protein